MKFFAWLSFIALCILLSIFVWESIEYCLNPPINIAEQGFSYVLSGSWFIAMVNIFAYLLIDPFQGGFIVDNKVFSVLVVFSVMSLLISFFAWAIQGVIKELR